MIAFRVYLLCDFKGCTREHRGIPHDDMQELPRLAINLRRIAEHEGWEFAGDHTYCPNHAERKEAERGK